MKIWVKTLVGKSVTLKMHPSDTLQNLQAKIHDKQGTHPVNQCLIILSEEAMEGKRLLSEDVNERLSNHPLALGFNGFCEFFVKTENSGPAVDLEVHPYDTIKNVKISVFEKNGIPTKMQNLNFGGKDLDAEERTLLSYGILNEATLLNLVMKIQIFLKNLSGKTKTIEIVPYGTVENLKRIIEEVEGVPADKQRIIYQGKQLTDEKRISDYKIVKECTVHLCLRLWSCQDRCPDPRE